MNDIEKAIKDLDYLKNCDSISSNYFKSIHGKYLELAVEALEKQIPKKIKVKQWTCAKCECGHEFLMGGLGEYFGIPWDIREKYCPDCGQRLEWEESE